jgi:cytochrome c peroxidase
MKRVVFLFAAACSAKSGGTHATDLGTGTNGSAGTGAATGSAVAVAIDAAGPVVLPPPPAAPAIPLGLPALDATLALRPEAIALGELLFFDPRLSASGRTSCATCHDPDHGWSDLRQHAATDAGEPNLRRTPAITNLAWQIGHNGFAWDGRYDTLVTVAGAHWKGQLGRAPVDAVRKLDNPTYAAHFARQPGAPAPGTDAQAAAADEALAAFVATRYQGDAPWDRYEHGDKSAVPAAAIAGYALFTGKAQCSTCHIPPLYTDGGFHALGLIKLADEGHGRVDPSARGAFKTPSLRGAVLHPPYFHDGSAATLEAAVDWHLAGGTGQGADRSIIDPALAPIVLAPPEREQLIAFVRALSPEPTHYHRPELP